MHFFIALISIIALTFILNVLIRQSYNALFFLLKRPYVWITVMLGIGLLYFYIGSRFDNSFNIVWTSALFALLLNIPSFKNHREKQEINEFADEVYDEWGIKGGRLKYRVGLAAYAIGGILGWVIFYGKIVQ